MLYRRYLTGVLPAIARRAARNPAAYEYLAESISDWPAQRELADVIRAAGWSSVRWRDLTLGVVADPRRPEPPVGVQGRHAPKGVARAGPLG